MALTKFTEKLISDSFKTTISGSDTAESSSFASRVTLVEAGSTSKTLVSSSAQIADDISGSFSKEHLGAKVANVVTSSAQISADISGSFGNQRVGTSDSPTFAGGTITGDFSVGGTLTAQEVHTEFESASILFTSGSTQFGNSSDDVHEFKGNTISGSVSSTGSFGSLVTVGLITATTSGGEVSTDANGHITSFQKLDVATAGGRLIGKSNRGTLGRLMIEQTANSTDGGYIRFETSPNGSTTPTEKMRITEAGNVGIGTNNPAFDLHIGGNSNSIFGANLGSDGVLIAPAANNVRLIIEGDNDASITLVDDGASSNEQAMMLQTDGGFTKFRSLNDDTGGNSDNIIVMNHSNGYVGVGISTPSSVLEINSDTYPQFIINGTDNSGNIGFILSGSGHRSSFRWNSSNNATEIVREDGTVEISSAYNGGTTFASSITTNGGATINGDTIVGRGGSQKGTLTVQSRTGTATRKTNAIVAVPYNDTSESICMIGMDGQSSNNEMHIGSNTSTLMSPTFIDFFVATSVNDETNNRKMRINNDGVTVGGTASPQRSLHVQGTGIVLSEGDRDRASLLSTYSDANDGAMIFNTRSGATSRERMRLTSTGNLCVGPSGSSAGFTPALTVTGNNPSMGLRGQDGNSGVFFNILVNKNTTKVTGLYPNTHDFRLATASNDGGTGETDRFILSNSGNLTIGGTLTESSDIRLKTNIEKIPDVLDVLDKIEPVKFEWKEDVEEGIEKKHIGLIAQEVEPHFPELIYEGTTRDTDDETYKGLNYAGLTPILLKAVQELSSKVNELEKKLNP